ncbi:MAG: hypothetical protein CSA53_05555 [Gammaproteobacteria bacterium]|nr:MAG: hypothetical protein CSA53_05555 [Gammaproteobacteria bacterium]
METYSTEEEQLEALRRWWNENGKSIIVGVVLAIACSAGWQFWQKHNQQQREGASLIYQKLLQAEGTASAEQQAASAQQLIDQYPGSSYARFAAMYLARLAVEADQLGEAQRHLRWVLTNSPTDDERDVAQLRLARVQAAAGDYDAALKVLSNDKSASYAASYAIAEGDTLMMAGRKDEARQAYEKARLLIEQEEGGQVPALLQQKLDRLNPVPARTVSDTAGA